MAIEIIKAKAEKLLELRAFISKREEEVDNELKAIKEERDTVQAELLEELKKDDLKSIKVSDGSSYIRASRKGIQITDPTRALFWAKENMCFSVDKRLAEQKISKMETAPDGFSLTETEYISIRKPKDVNGEN